MHVSAWLDIIGLIFILSISFICYKEGVLWPILFLCGSTLAHSLATSPGFQERVRAAFPCLEEALPSHYTIPVTVFVLTLFTSHYLARYIGAKMEHSAIRMLGSLNRLLGGILGVIVGLTIVAWGYRFVASYSPELAVYLEGSSVCTWCVEQEERFNFGQRIVALVTGEVEKARDVIEQRPLPQNSGRDLVSQGKENRPRAMAPRDRTDKCLESGNLWESYRKDFSGKVE